MDRRGFLCRAAGLLLASPPLTALVGACTRATSTSTATTSAPPTAPPTSGPPRIPWDELAAGLHGRLIRPGTPGYPVARLAYDPRFDDIRPRAIVMTTTTGDVARTIRFARDHGLPFAARCGGHSYGGYSLSDGIVIDVAASFASAGSVIPAGT